jgi:hypothetical protein
LEKKTTPTDPTSEGRLVEETAQIGEVAHSHSEKLLQKQGRFGL